MSQRSRSALHFPLLRDGPIDRDLFHRLIDHLHHLRALESVRDALLTRDAPLPLMHHLFGMDPTEYAEHGRRLGLIRPTGRPSEPAEAEETTVWDACKAFRKPKGEDLTPEDYLDLCKTTGLPLRTIWLVVQRASVKPWPAPALAPRREQGQTR